MLSDTPGFVLVMLALAGALTLFGVGTSIWFGVRAKKRRRERETVPKHAVARLAAEVGDQIGSPLGYALQNLEHVRGLIEANASRLPASASDALGDAMFGLSRAADNVRRLREQSGMTARVLPELEETDPLLGRGSRRPSCGPSCGRGRVLVVDDDEMVGRAVRRGLEHAYTVDVVLSGEAALARMDRHAYDVVVSDLWMPQMDGMQLHSQVCARDPGLARRFVFMTGSASDPTAQAFFAALPNICLGKPCGLSDLRDAVESCLAATEGSRVANHPQPVSTQARRAHLSVVGD